MKIKYLLFLFIVIAFTGFGAFGQEMFFVTAPNGLICRAAPSSDSDRMGNIPYGSLVELIETTNVHYEMVDNDEIISGSWVKIRVSYTCYLFSLLDKKKFQNENTWAQCYVFDGYLESLNKATVREEKLTKNQFNQLQKKASSANTKLEKIEDFDSIKSALGNRATWIMAVHDEVLLLDSFTLSNGKRYQINQESNDYGVVAYYPSEEVLLLNGGHDSDFSISLKTGEVLETVGNLEYIINSPNKKIRLNGFFPGQECSSYFFQEINNGDFKYLVDFGWGSIYGNQVCYFASFAWLDDTSFVYSYMDYSSNSESGEMIYCKGEIIYGGYSKGVHFEMDTPFLNREKQEASPQSDFLKIEKINENYAVGYKAYDEVFDAYSEMWILSANDTTAIDGIEANSCSIESVSPNGAYAVFSTSTVRWDYYSEADSALYHKWRAILVDLSTAEVKKHCPFDCGDHWNESNQWLDDDEVVFDETDVQWATNFSKIVAECSGDLNKDGIPDQVVVTQDTTHIQAPYQLEIYLRNALGELELISKTIETIPEQYPNGSFTPNYGFSSVSIVNGVLLIEIGLLRGKIVYKFRHQNDQFELIGYTRHQSNGLGELIFTDFNLSTGQHVEEIEYYDSDNPKKVKNRTVWIRPLPNLNTFQPYGNDWD